MNKLKKKSLYLALVAGLGAAGMAGSAVAVNVNPDGLGQVLIYPYYTVRNGTDTYVSLTNTTDQPKAVKVRFTEGKNSREVLDFNLYLSAFDMWTGAVVATSDGAKLITADNSCTYPAIPKPNGQAFVNYAFSGTVNEGIVDSGGDGETSSLDRTREGYFEVIEMGVITDTDVVAAVTHSAGVPDNCSFVQQSVLNMDMSSSGTHPLSAPTGGLAGNATLINVAAGTDFGYDPTALDNFTYYNIWNAASTILPDLTYAYPVSTVFADGYTWQSYWSYGEDAVSAVLMHDNVINDYVLDTATLSGTDWVITMPTKRYYVPVDDPDTSNYYDAYLPFTQNFWKDGACETVDISYWDREEQYVDNVSFSPPPPGQVNALCWESTIVTFNNSNVLGSSNSVNIPVNFENGWARLTFGNSSNFLPNYNNTDITSTSGTYWSAQEVSYMGLPVIGFMVQDFVNGNVGGVLSNYGGNFNHKTTTNIDWN